MDTRMHFLQLVGPQCNICIHYLLSFWQLLFTALLRSLYWSLCSSNCLEIVFFILIFASILLLIWFKDSSEIHCSLLAPLLLPITDFGTSFSVLLKLLHCPSASSTCLRFWNLYDNSSWYVLHICVIFSFVISHGQHGFFAFSHFNFVWTLPVSR